MTSGSAIVGLTGEDDGPIPLGSVTCAIIAAPPSCIEFVPSTSDLFVVGTYSLESNAPESQESNATQHRSGSLVVYRLNKDYKITLLQTVSTPSAVLDLHFSPHHLSTLAVALSTGAIEIYNLNPLHKTPLKHIETLQLLESSILVLSLAWCPDPKKSTMLAVSLSNGMVMIIDHDEFEAPTYKRFKLHAQECWTVAWALEPVRKDQYLLYSGADDSWLVSFRVGFPAGDTDDIPKMTAAGDGGNPDDCDPEDHSNDPELSSVCTLWNSVDRKIHGAGVTAIVLLNYQDSRAEPKDIRKRHAIVTGSYDEFVRVLAMDNENRCTVLTEKRLGGGVWRLKTLSAANISAVGRKFETHFQLLASCMHAGAKVLDIMYDEDQKWSISVAATFEEHQSMNYGSDATFELVGSERITTVVSTSFYDRKLCVWHPPKLPHVDFEYSATEGHEVGSNEDPRRSHGLTLTGQ